MFTEASDVAPSISAITTWSERSARRSQRRRRIRATARRQRLAIAVAIVALLMLATVVRAATITPTQEPAPASMTVPTTSVPPGATQGSEPTTRSVLSGTVPLVQSWPDVPYGDLLASAARRHGVDPALYLGLVKRESAGFQPTITSPAGARGLAQFMPMTARGMGLRVDLIPGTETALPGGVDERIVPAKAADAGARYLHDQLRAFGSVPLALAAYNAGGGAVRQYGGVPPYPETVEYVRIVQLYAAEFRAGGVWRARES